MPAEQPSQRGLMIREGELSSVMRWCQKVWRFFSRRRVGRGMDFFGRDWMEGLLSDWITWPVWNLSMQRAED